MEEKIRHWNEELKDKKAEEIIVWALDNFQKDKIGLSNSMSIEDMVLTDMIAPKDKTISIFTLDTGRLFQETYDLMENANRKYKINIEILFPESASVEALVREKGPNLFYYNIEDRKRCCAVRKLEPLKRKLSGLDIWITGLRRDQSVTRENIGIVEWDNVNNLYKLNPLHGWNEEQVWDYIKTNNVPYSTLYNKGYRSIGCLPCTRAVKEGEDLRSGRWWWENPETRECGLHVKPAKS